MVVAKPDAKLQRMAGGLGDGLQQLRAQLAIEELVVAALVDQQRQFLLRRLHQLAGIPVLPRLAVIAQIGCECLLTPRHLRRRHDWRERRHAAVAARIAQRQHQRAMPAHRVAADRARAGGREMRLDQRRQLLHHVLVHAVMRRPGLLGGIEVEAGALAQVVAFRIGHLVAARAGVRRDQDDPVFGRVALRTGLGDEVLLGAGQAGQPVQHRAWPVRGLRRQVHGEIHRAAEYLRSMPVNVLPATEAGAVFDPLHRPAHA